jgi:hypothetical protein
MKYYMDIYFYRCPWTSIFIDVQHARGKQSFFCWIHFAGQNSTAQRMLWGLCSIQMRWLPAQAQLRLSSADGGWDKQCLECPGPPGSDCKKYSRNPAKFKDLIS